MGEEGDLRSLPKNFAVSQLLVYAYADGYYMLTPCVYARACARARACLGPTDTGKPEHCDVKDQENAIHIPETRCLLSVCIDVHVCIDEASEARVERTRGSNGGGRRRGSNVHACFLA